MEDTYACNIPNYSAPINIRCEELAPVAAPARQNAFRAVKNDNQFLDNVASYQQITFEDPQFDYGNVYREATSTFRPRSCGVYTCNATVAFIPADSVENTIYVMLSTDGGTTGEQFCSSFMPNSQTNIVNVSTVLQLGSGDRVQVSCRPSVPGTVLAEFTNFSAALCPFTDLTSC